MRPSLSLSLFLLD